MWQQREVSDGTYSFMDLLIAHEILDVQDANRIAYQEWARAQHG
jgi:hypothetical protein